MTISIQSHLDVSWEKKKYIYIILNEICLGGRLKLFSTIIYQYYFCLLYKLGKFRLLHKLDRFYWNQSRERARYTNVSTKNDFRASYHVQNRYLLSSRKNEHTLLVSYQYGKTLSMRRLNNRPIVNSMLRLQPRHRSIIWSSQTTCGLTLSVDTKFTDPSNSPDVCTPVTRV